MITRHVELTKNPFLLETLRGIEDAKGDSELVFIGSIRDREQFFKVVKEIKVEGLLITAMDMELSCEDYLLLRDDVDIPFVLLYTHIYQDGIYSVFTDMRMGTAKLTSHLINLGHRVIAFINGTVMSKGDMERIEGYRLPLQRCGIRYNKGLVRWNEYEKQKTIHEVDALLNLSRRPSAILASDDMAAVDIINMLKKRVQ